MPVPDVVGMVDSFAKTKIETVGLKYTVSNIIDLTQKDDVVLSCDPAPGTPVSAGSSVKIVVNAPPKSIKLLNYTGITEQNALQDLKTRGMTVNEQFEPSRAFSPGYVIRTSPPTDTMVSVGGTVTVYVAK